MPEAMFQVGAVLKVESAQIKPGIGPNNISEEPYPSGYHCAYNGWRIAKQYYDKAVYQD